MGEKKMCCCGSPQSAPVKHEHCHGSAKEQVAALTAELKAALDGIEKARRILEDGRGPDEGRISNALLALARARRKEGKG